MSELHELYGAALSLPTGAANPVSVLPAAAILPESLPNYPGSLFGQGVRAPVLTETSLRMSPSTPLVMVDDAASLGALLDAGSVAIGQLFQIRGHGIILRFEGDYKLRELVNPYAVEPVEGMLRLRTTPPAGAPSVTCIVRSSTGYVCVQWWDGTTQFFGTGSAASNISCTKAIAATGNFRQGSPKELFIWPCASASDATVAGSLTQVTASTGINVHSFTVPGPVNSFAAVTVASDRLYHLDFGRLNPGNLGSLNIAGKMFCLNVDWAPADTPSISTVNITSPNTLRFDASMFSMASDLTIGGDNARRILLPDNGRYLPNAILYMGKITDLAFLDDWQIETLQLAQLDLQTLVTPDLGGSSLTLAGSVQHLDFRSRVLELYAGDLGLISADFSLATEPMYAIELVDNALDDAAIDAFLLSLPAAVVAGGPYIFLEGAAMGVPTAASAAAVAAIEAASGAVYHNASA